jgi:UDP-N-acetylglucosamine diphosphorylase / glucose-1-phosphate thymidylyltransferase / UDP-N-acetylgalactosamine diphosphorylase / glucosamine-1-phosphate N-acetyltransferase / galactosamine-1-phosphate N-acetyltransferase
MAGRPALILFDDDTSRLWEPYALTRPAGELIFGAFTLRERWERVLGLHCAGHIAAEHLEGFEEDGAPPVLRPGDAQPGGARLYLSSRFVPEWGASWEEPAAAGPVSVGGETAGWYAPEGTRGPDAGFLRSPGGYDAPAISDLPGRALERVWELVTGNPEQLGRDLAALHGGRSDQAPEGTHVLGKGGLVLDEGVRVEPGVVLDTSAGPIWLREGVTVRAFTRLAGPAVIGRGSTLMGGSIEVVSTGPVCRLRGELAESVCLGYVNKAHDGHMGHAYLGRWVNLGAETTNSDLKNNYGTIRMWTPGGEADSGAIKLGSLLGDHVKTGIGLLLNTGTVVGAGSNLFGAAMPPKYVPPFSWGSGEELVEFRLDKFLEVAERAMGRRDVELSAPLREMLGAAWERGREMA